MTKKRRKAIEYRKIIAVFLVTYIIATANFTYENFLEKFNQNEISGKAIARVSINIISRCNLNLGSEYNLISLCANVDNNSVKKVLEPINGKYAFVLKWNKASQNFETYSPEAAVNDFEYFDMNESYFIYMNENTNLNVGGSDFGDVNISLEEEYNAPIYPYQFNVNITKYLNNIRTDISFALKWNNTEQKFVTYSPEAAVNEFEMIEKGEGQFIYVLTPTVLKYNKTLLKP